MYIIVFYSFIEMGSASSAPPAARGATVFNIYQKSPRLVDSTDGTYIFLLYRSNRVNGEEIGWVEGTVNCAGVSEHGLPEQLLPSALDTNPRNDITGLPALVILQHLDNQYNYEVVASDAWILGYRHTARWTLRKRKL